MGLMRGDNPRDPVQVKDLKEAYLTSSDASADQQTRNSARQRRPPCPNTYPHHRRRSRPESEILEQRPIRHRPCRQRSAELAGPRQIADIDGGMGSVAVSAGVDERVRHHPSCTASGPVFAPFEQVRNEIVRIRDLLTIFLPQTQQRHNRFTGPLWPTSKGDHSPGGYPGPRIIYKVFRWLQLFDRRVSVHAY